MDSITLKDNLLIVKLIKPVMLKFYQIRIKISAHSMYVLLKKINAQKKQIDSLQQDYENQSERYYELEQKVDSEMSQGAIDDFHTDKNMPF